MPSRRLARYNDERNMALTQAKDRKDAIADPADIPFMPGTITRLDTFQPTYKGLMDAVKNALVNQAGLTSVVRAARQLASFYISDLIDAMQRAVRRGEFDASVRAHYGLPVSLPKRPLIRTEAEVLEWGPKAIDGENARRTAGGDPITFPTLTNVEGAFNDFKTKNLDQAALKDAYDNAQEAVEEENEEADKLILKLWNEIETFYDEGDKPSMRRKAREWGVVYVPSPGEEPSPEEFSLIGTATLAGSGDPAPGVTIRVVELDVSVVTGEDGTFFFGLLAPGTYTVEATGDGLQTNVKENVLVSEDEVRVLDFEMQPEGNLVTISGTVTDNSTGGPIENATIVLFEGTEPGSDAIEVTTGSNGDYIIEITSLTEPKTGTLRASAANYINEETSIDLEPGNDYPGRDFALGPVA